MKKEEKSMKNIKLKLATILLLSSALMLSACAGVEEDKEKGTASQNSGADELCSSTIKYLHAFSSDDNF